MKEFAASGQSFFSYALTPNYNLFLKHSEIIVGKGLALAAATSHKGLLHKKYL